MKKSVIIVTLLFLILTLSFVSAQTLPAPQTAAKDITEFITKLLVGASGTTIDITARFLLFLILTIILYRAAEALTKSSSIGMILSILVSILALRYLGTKEIIGLIIPYTALGIVISVFVPFMLYGYLIVTSSLPATLRKIGWMLMIVIFTILWYLRWAEIGDLAWIYFIGIVLTLVMLLMDGTIRKLTVEMKIARGKATVLNIQIDAAKQEIDKLYEQLKGAKDEEARKAILSQIKELENDIKVLSTKLAKQ
ncbi:MAG: hypothetical protein QW041_02205 [Candidatus Pacearchaeota archaeon]